MVSTAAAVSLGSWAAIFTAAHDQAEWVKNTIHFAGALGELSSLIIGWFPADFSATTRSETLREYAARARDLGCATDAEIFNILAAATVWQNTWVNFASAVVSGSMIGAFLDNSGIFKDAATLREAAIQRMAALPQGKTFAGDSGSSAVTTFMNDLSNILNAGNQLSEKYGDVKFLLACNQNFNIGQFQATVSGLYQYIYTQNAVDQDLTFSSTSLAFASDAVDPKSDIWAGITQSPNGGSSHNALTSSIVFEPGSVNNNPQLLVVARDDGSGSGGIQYKGWIKIDLRALGFGSTVYKTADWVVFTITSTQATLMDQLNIIDNSPHAPEAVKSPWPLSPSGNKSGDANNSTNGPDVIFDVEPPLSGTATPAGNGAATSNGLRYYLDSTPFNPVHFDLDQVALAGADASGGGQVVVYGGTGNDWITGTAGNQRFVGGSGDDTLNLSGDNDYASVGLGAQVLIDGKNNELMVNGDSLSGRDGIFIFNGIANSLNFSTSFDGLIFDNVAGKLDISKQTDPSGLVVRHASATGFDVLWGGQGNDIFNFSYLDGNIMPETNICGGNGNDVFNMTSCTGLTLKTGLGNNTISLTDCTDAILETSASANQTTISVGGNTSLRATLLGNDNVNCDRDISSTLNLDIRGGIHKLAINGQGAAITVDGQTQSVVEVDNGGSFRNDELVGVAGTDIGDLAVFYDSGVDSLTLFSVDHTDRSKINADIEIYRGLDRSTFIGFGAANDTGIGGTPVGGELPNLYSAAYLIDKINHLSAATPASAFTQIEGLRTVWMSSLVG